MENKENMNVNSLIDRPLSLSLKLNSKISNINNEIEMEKEYLAKLKIQRQKTERLHSEFIKSKSQTDKLKENHKKEVSSFSIKLQKFEEDYQRKNQQCDTLEKQIRRLKLEIQNLRKDKSDSIEKNKHTYEIAIQEYQRNIQSLNETLQNKNKSMNTLKKNHNSKLKQLETLNYTLKEELKQAEEGNRYNQIKNKDAQKELENLKKNNQTVLYNMSKCQNQLESKIKEISFLKISNNKFQQENQTSGRKINDLESNVRFLEGQITEGEKSHDFLEQKFQKCEEQLRETLKQKEKIEKQFCRVNDDVIKLKQQVHLKQEILKQSQTKLMRQMESQDWKQRYLQLQFRTQQLQTTSKALKEENETLMSFVKQKNLLEKQRRSLMQYQMEQIQKFQHLLKDVK